MILALRDLVVCMNTKQYFHFFNLFMKTRYFNIGFIFLRCKNINRYQSKWIEKIGENITNVFFINIFNCNGSDLTQHEKRANTGPT
jgi:hypothetical protein